MPFGPNTAAVAGQRLLGVRNDPYVSCNFQVEIQGLITGGFAEVSGLDITTAVEPLEEGGVNNYVHKFPKGTSYSDVILKKGVSDLDTLWYWYQETVNGNIQRRSVTIFLLGPSGFPAMWWNLRRAFPVSIGGPSFNAASSQVSMETLTLAHEGLEKPASSQIYGGVKGVATAGGFPL